MGLAIESISGSSYIFYLSNPAISRYNIDINRYLYQYIHICTHIQLKICGDIFGCGLSFDILVTEYFYTVYC